MGIGNDSTWRHRWAKNPCLFEKVFSGFVLVILLVWELFVQPIWNLEAERSIKKLSKQNLKTVFTALEKLRAGEDCLGIEKIKANPAFYRLRAGNLRIVYYPLAGQRVVLLLIGDRNDICQKTAALNQKSSTAMRKLRTAQG